MAQAQFPQFKLPKIDLEAVFALQKANLAVVHEVQLVLVDAAQSIVKAQADYAADLVARARGGFDAKAPRKPEAVLAEVKAAAEKAVAVGKHNVDLGFAAQRRVVDLATQRAQANLDELKKLAA